MRFAWLGSLSTAANLGLGLNEQRHLPAIVAVVVVVLQFPSSSAPQLSAFGILYLLPAQFPVAQVLLNVSERQNE